MNSETKVRLQNLCKNNLKFLCKEILEMKDWDDSLHGWLARCMDAPGNEKLLLFPRGHLKTSIVTVGWTIQEVLRNPDVRILINNAVWDNARTILSQISGYLTDKSPLPEIFGPFANARVRWTRDEIEIAQRRTGSIKESTIMTGGVESAKTGLHFDRILNDDIVVRENVTTKEQTEKVVNFHRDCYALLDPGGKIIDIGTRWAMNDLYGQIIEREMESINGYVFKSDEERKDWRKYLHAA